MASTTTFAATERGSLSTLRSTFTPRALFPPGLKSASVTRASSRTVAPDSRAWSRRRASNSARFTWKALGWSRSMPFANITGRVKDEPWW